MTTSPPCSCVYPLPRSFQGRRKLISGARYTPLPIRNGKLTNPPKKLPLTMPVVLPMSKLPVIDEYVYLGPNPIVTRSPRFSPIGASTCKWKNVARWAGALLSAVDELKVMYETDDPIARSEERRVGKECRS